MIGTPFFYHAHILFVKFFAVNHDFEYVSLSFTTIPSILPVLFTGLIRFF